jgi:hypothetical protein
MAGAESTAAVPTNVASEFIKAVPGTSATGVGAAEGAAGADMTYTQTPSFWSSFLQGLQGLQGAGFEAGNYGATV